MSAGAVSVAYGSAKLFDVSFALGAFFAGMMMRESDFSHRAAEDEFRRAVEHCRTNPVRHGLVSDPDLWPYSSFAKARRELTAA